jgi:integrase/recombinase XerD
MDTGMRVGEALSLYEKDVLNDRRTIFRNSNICKSRKDKYVFYSITMQKILNRWIDYKDRYLNTYLLFPTIKGTKMEVTNMEKNVKKYVIRAGVDSSINCSDIIFNINLCFLNICVPLRTIVPLSDCKN